MQINRLIPHRRRGRKGNAMIEFALVATILLPLLFGVVNLGFNLSRSVQVSQVVRDIGHLYVRNLDFSLAASTNMAVRLCAGLGLTANGGDGVLILSQIMYITDTECTNNGIALGSCTNRNKAVVVQRHVIGNASLQNSAFATPDSSIVLLTDNLAAGLKKGDITAANYLTNASAGTTGFTSILTGMQGGEVAFVVEGYFRSNGWNFSQGFTANTEGVYARVIF